MRWTRRAAAVVLLLTGWAGTAVAVASPAVAHATVASSDPADGSRLQAAPQRVAVTFTESVSIEAGFLKVVDGRGDQVSEGDGERVSGDDASVAVRLRPGLPDGSYIVSFRVLSADSHPISGALAFVVGDGPLVAATGAVVGGATDPFVNAVFVAARWLAFSGVVLLGGLVFLVLCWPAGRADRRARRLVWVGWGSATGAAILGLLLEGPYAAGTGLLDALSPDLLGATVSTTYGRMLCARLVLLGVLGALAARLLRDRTEQPERTRARDEDLAAIAGLGVLATYGGVGHAAAGATPTLALLSDTTHLAAVATWIGGLTVLVACLLPTRRTEEMASALPRFSRIALGAVAVLVVTGSYQAWREVGTIPALTSTEYGRLLLVKLTGVLLLIALGAVSRAAVRRRYLIPAVRAVSTSDAAEVEGVEEDRLLHRLRTSAGLEVTIAAAVLAVTAILASTAPARATYVEPFQTSVALASGGSARLSVSPMRAGANTVEIAVLDQQGNPSAARSVTVTVQLAAEQIGPLPVQLSAAGVGRWTGNASLPRPGTWSLVLRVQRGDFDRDVAQAELVVR